MTTRTLLTAEQFYEMPDDDLRHDLVEGEVRSISLAGGEHGKIALRLAARMLAHAEAHGLGEVAAAETGFVLARDPDTVLGSDIAFVRAQRVPPGGVPKKHWPIAPDIAVEIVSPGDRAGELDRKVASYLQARVRLVWVLYPDKQQVVVHSPNEAKRTLAHGDVLEGADVLPEFSCPVRELWP